MERKTQVKQKSSIFFYVFICLFTFLNACQKTSISTEDFDSSRWKDDKNGCLGERSLLKSDFDNVKDKLVGLGENETRKLLGAPDKVQLLERSQKFYVYYFEKGSQCGQGLKEGKSYHVRFNSLNQVNEVSLSLPVD